LNSKYRSDRNTYILVGNMESALIFVFVFIEPNRTKQRALIFI
jgi:hypothetical protein